MALPAWARSRRLILAVGAVVYLAAAVSLLILLPISTSDGTGATSTGGGGWDAAARSIIGRLPWASRGGASHKSSSSGSYGGTVGRDDGATALQVARPGGAGVTRTDPRDVQPATEPSTEEANSAYAVGTILTMLAVNTPVFIANDANECLTATTVRNEWGCFKTGFQACSDADKNQGWILEDSRVRSAANLCLDLYRDATKVHACPCHSDANQQWSALPNGQLASLFRPDLCLNAAGLPGDLTPVECATDRGVLQYVVRPPLPTKTPRRGRLSPKPVVNMPYMGIPDGGLARDDGTVSWEDTAALDYVRDMMRFAWAGYEEYAWGADELRPVSMSSRNWLGPSGLAATIVDALDTLWIMGLEEEYSRARDYVHNELTFDKDVSVSFFETTIRDLGGLLAAYALTNDHAYVDKADDLGRRLMRAFNSPTGMPYGTVNLRTGASGTHGWSAGAHVLAEVGTFQLEFRYLSHVTGKREYADIAEKVTNYVMSLPTSEPGLYPNYLPLNGGLGSSREYSFGGLGDSFYEYLIKQWLFTGRTEHKFLKAHEDAISSCMRLMIGRTGGRNPRVYLGKHNGMHREKSMEHLTCFSGGLFALGASVRPDAPTSKEEFEIGAALTETCKESYQTTATHLGPERFTVGDDGKLRPASGGEYYILRPEYVESLFYLWRLTHDRKYREWGWDVIMALEKNARIGVGYSGLQSVNRVPPVHGDVQESFFLAETLKYLYLLYADDTLLPLDQWVFNTEAHPLPVIQLDPTTGI